jgi:outer membrane protein
MNMTYSTLTPRATRTTTRFFVSTCLILASVFVTSLASAQSKVGFVNTEKVLKESAPAQEALRTLGSEFSRRESSLVEMSGDLKRRSDRLERDGATLSATERQRLQAELADLDAKFQRERRNLEEEVQARRNQLLGNILERANREIIRIAEAEKIDIIFQDAVWASPNIDITSKVLEALRR